MSSGNNETDRGGWGCFLALAVVSTLLGWVWQGITWPFRVISRQF